MLPSTITLKDLGNETPPYQAAQQRSLAQHTEWTWAACLHGKNLGVNRSEICSSMPRLNRALKKF